MKERKKVFIYYYGFCAILAFYFIFSAGGGGGGSSDEEMSKEDKALAALMGGGGGRRPAARHEGDSIFDSDFFKAGEPTNPIEEKAEASGPQGDGNNEILEPANPNNPVNPQTGQPFSDTVMEQFDTLRKRFPGNSIIPR